MSLALAQLVAASLAIHGRVMADVDGDRRVSAADRPVRGALVFWETGPHASTDGEGNFLLEAPGPGIIWVSTPDGFSPAPVWREVRGGEGAVVLLLERLKVGRPLRFVHASDTHLGTNSADETRRALEQATGTDPPPWFLVVTGDITAGTHPAEFAALAAALAGFQVPFVPVVGNHDWHDGGTLYRQRLGPPMYSFDAGGAHFIVLNFMASEEAELTFVDDDLAARPAPGLVVALRHATPSDAMAAALAGHGVAYLFTGHTHDNRVMERGSLIEVNTQTAVMGGIDYTPAGYRLVELRDGRLRFSHHTVVREPLVTVSHPRPGDCVPAGDLPVIAAVELGAAPDAVDFSLDGARSAPLSPTGGWTYSGALALLAPGWHTLSVAAHRGGKALAATSRFCVTGAKTRGGSLPDWPMLQGSAEHHGFTPTRLSPPLWTLWARAIGGHARAGPPVLADGRLFVPVADLSDSRSGGLLALEAQSGRLLWERRGIGSVAASPAVEDDAVVFTTTDGWLHAHRTLDGVELWKVDLAAGIEETNSPVYSPPVISSGRVYAGNTSRFAAVALASGATIATTQARSIWSHLYSAPAISRGRVVVPLGRGADSLLSFDADRLAQRWTRSFAASTKIQGSPLIDGDTVYVGNAESFLSALDLDSGEPRWTAKLYASWSMWNLATPALGHGLLFVATPHEHLFAVDAATGTVRWKRAAGASRTHPVPYQREARGFLASPVVTADLLWAGGIDGVLRAFDVQGGDERWQMDLGAPIVGGLVPATNLLFVVTYDGTVRALTAAPAHAPLDPDAEAGCGAGWSCALDILAGAAAALWIFMLGRRVARRAARKPWPRSM